MSAESAEKIIEGNWEQLKGKIKNQWGNLTDKDIDKMNGSYEALAGKIKESYGSSKEEIEKQMKEVISAFNSSDMKKMAENSLDKIKDKFEDSMKYVKENPVKSILISLACGILFSKIVK